MDYQKSSPAVHQTAYTSCRTLTMLLHYLVILYRSSNLLFISKIMQTKCSDFAWTKYNLFSLLLTSSALWSLATLWTLLQLTPVILPGMSVTRAYFDVLFFSWIHQVGTQCIATLAGLSDGSRRICPTSVNLLTLTIIDIYSIPFQFYYSINSVFPLSIDLNLTDNVKLQIKDNCSVEKPVCERQLWTRDYTLGSPTSTSTTTITTHQWQCTMTYITTQSLISIHMIRTCLDHLHKWSMIVMSSTAHHD